VRWGLPDDVCAIYVGDECWALFRYGARRRRKREYSRTDYWQEPFSDDEIAWVCAKKHVQERGRRLTGGLPG